jgi:hypothetical protein
LALIKQGDEMKNLRRVLKSVVLVGIAVHVPASSAAQDVAGAAEVSIKKLDAVSKAIVVDTANGAEQTYPSATIRLYTRPRERQGACVESASVAR